MNVISSTMLNDDDFEWKDHTSAKGKPFQIGIPKKSLIAATVTDQSLGTKKDFGVTVEWANSKNVWVPITSQNVIDTAAITRYSLGPYNSFGYQWKLCFTNTEHYDYHFYDKTGDSYEVNTYINSDHSVRYSSDDPEIIYITGS